MTDQPAPRSGPVIDSALRIALVALLVLACLKIMAPFAGILAWATILAVILYPLHLWLRTKMSNGKSATLIGVVSVALLLVPLVLAISSLGSSLYELGSGVINKTLVMPPPPPKLETVPIVGAKLSAAWSNAAANLPAVLNDHAVQLREGAASLAKFAGGLAGGALSFIAALAIAAVLIAYGESGAQMAKDVFSRVTGDAARGERLTVLTAKTIRGVGQGVVGVAVIQAILIGIGLFVMGIPFAGALTLVALLMGIIQLPALLLILPVVGYAFATGDTTPAIIFAVYMFAAGLSDNILKPLLLGRGLEVPMPVILIGVIGGMLADGLVGLFIGPVVLGVGYVLFLEWVRPPTLPAA